MTPEQIAGVCHEANRAYCRTLGDVSQPAWEQAQRASAISGVQFHLTHPGAAPRASHDEWLRIKADEGWRFGPVKNPVTREHPCFLPYDQLPEEQRRKDVLFTAIVHALSQAL